MDLNRFEKFGHNRSRDDSDYKSAVIDVCDCCGSFWPIHELTFSTTTMSNLCPICYNPDQESDQYY